jgi:hypothetical protein
VDGVWSDKKDKVFVSTMLLVIVPTLGAVAPPLLVAGNESIQWEVVWLIRSVRGFLFR